MDAPGLVLCTEHLIINANFDQTVFDKHHCILINLIHHNLFAQDNIQFDSSSESEQDKKAQSALTSAPK